MAQQLPSINIKFSEIASASIKRGLRGIVTLILKDESVDKLTHTTMYDIGDIPTDLNDYNVKRVQDTFKGYTNTPNLVELIVIPTEVEVGEVEELTDVLNFIESMKFDYLVFPKATLTQKINIDLWVKSVRNNGFLVKTVLSDLASDCEAVVNVTQKDVELLDGEILSSDDFTARVGGLIAGTDSTISCTYAPLSDVVSIPIEQQAVTSQKVAKGEFVLLKEANVIKVAKGINSLVTTNQNKGISFQKIKIVETMDMISNDIRGTIRDSYIGKYTNSYDNKILLISAINGYLDKLVLEGLVNTGYNVQIDLDVQKAYLKGKGVKVHELTDDEIREYPTDDQVFLRIDLKILDAIENVSILAYI